MTLNWTEIQPQSTVDCLLAKLGKAKQLEKLILSVNWDEMYEKKFYCDPFELFVYGDSRDFFVKLFHGHTEPAILFEVTKGRVKINMEYADITKRLLEATQ